jgi:hypothetical protein
MEKSDDERLAKLKLDVDGSGCTSAASLKLVTSNFVRATCTEPFATNR